MSLLAKDRGFILRRYNFRETSIIATIYTLNFGKISGIFKGFYTLKREFASGLDIFSLNEFIFYPKKNPIWLVSFADLIDDYNFLTKSIRKSSVAAIMASIIDKTMPSWDVNPEVFYLLEDCLKRLKDQDDKKILYVFLVKFLSVCGFKPELTACLFCKSHLIDNIFFSVTSGGLICRKCKHLASDSYMITKPTSLTLRYIQENKYDLVYRLKSSLSLEEEMLKILKQFLFYHLDFDLSLYLKDTRRGNR